MLTPRSAVGVRLGVGFDGFSRQQMSGLRAVIQADTGAELVKKGKDCLGRKGEGHRNCAK